MSRQRIPVIKRDALNRCHSKIGVHEECIEILASLYIIDLSFLTAGTAC